MRTIDADALMKKFAHTPELIYTNVVLDVIRSAPTVGGWISVEDKLPRSVANKVLVWLEHEELTGCIGFGHYEKYKGQEIWFDLENNHAFSARGYKVTHWTPLPEPPKEENDNEDAQS